MGLPRSFGAVLLLPLLAACTEEPVTRSEIAGKFCDTRNGLDYALLLSTDERYRYTVTSDSGTPVLSHEGTSWIYGSPVTRVELRDICTSVSQNRWCGDYSAEVLKEWGKLKVIVEDVQGAPLELEKCAIGPYARDNAFLKPAKAKSPARD